jgi:glutamate N-acetyltransferase/amino-acid N-acetyltransferase
MTTDTRPKLASASIRIGKKTASVLGVAKGAGMIHPDMATMLVYLLTDAAGPPQALRRVLRRAVAQSFHCISIDGDTSTNDTVVLMASGAAGVPAADHEIRFATAVTSVCESLAEQIVADGEGVTHRVTLRVEGAANHAAAARIARTVAQSLLVKTAWAGADPNWGRVLAAAGRAGVALDPSRVDIWIGGQKVCARGAAVAFDQKRAHVEMSKPAYEIRVRVGSGSGSSRLLTADLTAEYVHINADYSS